MNLIVNEKQNRTANNWLHEKVAALDATNSSAYAFVCGEIHAAYILNVITREQYEELEQLVDNKFYEVHFN